MDFLENLNEKQRQAVTAPKQPILVLAGPGTGKTRTLVARILYLIDHYEIPPDKILAVTFTNKAKEEMRHRLREKLDDTASDLMIGTFHRYCLDTLRAYHHEADLPKQFAIADETAQLMTLSRVSRINDERSLRTVLNAISSYRLNRDNLNPTFQGAAVKWLQHYHQELRKNNLIDFDQIILLTQKLFAEHPELVETQQQHFDAILVDEFQDTDPVQYGIMRALAQKHRNIFVVADDDQSIFAWRGAHIENIARYLNDFNCRESMIVLNQNYRSAQCIIDIATNLLRGHHFQEKEIHAAPSSGKKPLKPDVQFLAFEDDETEIEFMTEQIESLTYTEDPELVQYPDLTSPLRYDDIAVLYPTHAIGEKLEMKLLKSRIPCQLVKRQGVFDQEDVRKIILLLKLLQNPEDDVTLEQFFELELNNKLIFEQVKSFKSKKRTFKQTLHHIMRYETLSGISRGQFSKIVHTCFGMISNLISYVKSNPLTQLDDLINMICNLLIPEHSATIHGKVQELCDPYDISGIPEAVESIRQTLANGGKIYVTGKDPDITNICYTLLCKGIDAYSPVEGEQNGNAGELRDFPTDGKDHGCLCCLYPRSFPSVGNQSSQLQVSSDKDALFLCLDSDSTKTLLDSYPNISKTRFIVLHPVSESSPIERGPGGVIVSSPFTTTVTIFKLLQALSSAKLKKPFRNYVALDLETTSSDIHTTGIVEFGAVKVRDGKIIAELGTLVNPEKPITQGAYKVHHISDKEVRDKKTFAQFLPEFLEFIGDDMLVAHNGFGFDFPIILRLYRDATGKLLPNRRFDTLPLARRLFPGQPASVDALMERFGIQDVGGRHRALDDTIYLTPIFERLQEVELSLNRRSEHEELLELVALGMYLENSHPLEEAFSGRFFRGEAAQFSSWEGQGGGKKVSGQHDVSEPTPTPLSGVGFFDKPPERRHEFPSWEGQGVGKDRSEQHDPPEPTPNPSQEGNLVTSSRKNLPLRSPTSSQEGDSRSRSRSTDEKSPPGRVGGDEEEQILFQFGVRKLFSRFSELPEQFQSLLKQNKAEIQELFEGVTNAETDDDSSVSQIFSGKDVSIARLKELAKSFQARNVREAIRQFLDHAVLYATQDDIRDVNAVNLFTIHSAKGLEFPVVFVSGVEKGNLPSFYSVREEGKLREKKLDEQRRLFYVAMTRAKRKLFVTYVDKRGDYSKKRSQFLIELGVETEEEVRNFEEDA